MTSTIVFYQTRVYQMQHRNGQNWHSSVGKYVHHKRETAKIGIRTPLKLYVYFRFVSETTGIKPTTFPSRTQSFMENGKELRT